MKRYTPGKTSVQYYNEVLEMIRNEIGSASYWLGCISSFQHMVGYVDGMRVSNDVGTTWTTENTVNMFREMYAGHFFNTILWQNDPDVLFLRDYAINYSKDEKYSIALYDGFMGGALTTSCQFHTLTDENMRLWNFILPGDRYQNASLPFWSESHPILVAVRDYPQQKGKAILFINTTDQPSSSTYSIKELCGVENSMVYEWLPGTFKTIKTTDTLNVNLPPHASKLIYVSSSNELPLDSFKLNR